MIVSIREAVPANDAEDLKRFLLGSNSYESQFESDRRLDTAYPGEFLADRIGLAQFKQGKLFVAEAPTKALIGWAMCYVDHAEAFVEPDKRPFGYIAELYVEEEWRGKHVGRKLMSACETYFRSLGIGSIMITALSANVRAVAAYRAAEFTDHSINFRKIL